MRKTLSVIAMVISITSFCQDKNITIDLKGMAYLKSYIDLGDAGILFHEAWAKIANKHPGAIHYYSAKGDLIWKKKITNIQSAFITASPDGSVVYHGTMKGSISLLQIKSNGTTVEKELPDSKKIRKNLTTVFCDKSFIYFLSTLNGDQLSDKKRGADKLIVHRFKHTDFSYKQFTLALPAINSNDNTSFWAFLGQKGDTKYLLSKEVDPKAGTIRFSIVSFNPEGIIGKQFTIDHTIPADQELVEPFSTMTLMNGNVILEGMDKQFTGTFTSPGLPHDGTGGSTTALFATTNGRFTYFSFDPIHEQFHLLVLTKEKTRKNPYELSYYISQYNKAGDMMWNNTLNHLGDRSFSMDYLLPEGALDITTYSETGIICTELSRNDGKSIGTQKFNYGVKKMEYLLIMEAGPIKILNNGKILRSTKFIIDNVPEGDRKSSTFQNFISSKGEILLLTTKKGGTRLLCFATK